MLFPRLCVTSTSGGGGKTLLSLGLASALRARGLAVKPFKKGPDYIDAAWLGAAAGVAATNLDPFFMTGPRLKDLFCASMLAANAKIGLIEGNRGLYDGLNESGVCSTAQLCRALACPILLCIDCAKSTRTIAAIVKGIVAFEEGLNFAGAILNRIGSARHENSLRAALAANCDLPILGALPRLEANPLPERHMGLAAMNKKSGEILTKLGAFVANHCDLDAMIAAASQAPQLAPPETAAAPKIRDPAPKIGVVIDSALWFYYPENLAALANEGAEIVKLSLFDAGDSTAWHSVDALYMGGGFPEDYADEISQSPWLAFIASRAAKGMPIYAECGGLILLGSTFSKEGSTFAMAGVFPLDIAWNRRPIGLGYVDAAVIRENPWFPVGARLACHEFHYSSCSRPEDAPETALKLDRGAGLYRDVNCAFDGLFKNNVWASYSHIFAPAVPGWAPAFVRLAAKSAADRRHLASGDSDS